MIDLHIKFIAANPKNKTQDQQIKRKNNSNAYIFLDSIKNKYQTDGFLSCLYVVSKKNDTTWSTRFNLGKQTKFHHITYINHKAYYHLRKEVIPFKETEYHNNKLISHLIKNKNPLTQIIRKPITIRKDTLYSQYTFIGNTKKIQQKVVIQNYPKFPKKIKKQIIEKSFDKTNNTKKIDDELKKLVYLKHKKASQLLISKDTIYTYIYSSKRKAHFFDGIIGFGNQNGKWLVNGNINLELNNLFNKGNTYLFKWQNNGSGTEDIKLSHTAPYIFKSKLLFNTNFELFRQDNQFSRRATNFNISLPILNNHFIGVGYEQKNSNNLNNNNNLDYKATFLKISYAFKSNGIVNNEFKHKAEFDINSGKRKNMEAKLNQTSIHIKQHHHFIKNKNTIYFRNVFNQLISDKILESEVFIFGGIDNQRGFIDNSLIATTYNTSTIEYRRETGSKEYLYALIDHTISRNKTIEEQQKITAFGIGYQFKNNNSIINLAFAVGKTEESPLNLNKGRIHLRWINQF